MNVDLIALGLLLTIVAGVVVIVAFRARGVPPGVCVYIPLWGGFSGVWVCEADVLRPYRPSGQADNPVNDPMHWEAPGEFAGDMRPNTADSPLQNG